MFTTSQFSKVLCGDSVLNRKDVLYKNGVLNKVLSDDGVSEVLGDARYSDGVLNKVLSGDEVGEVRVEVLYSDGVLNKVLSDDEAGEVLCSDGVPHKVFSEVLCGDCVFHKKDVLYKNGVLSNARLSVDKAVFSEVLCRDGVLNKAELGGLAERGPIKKLVWADADSEDETWRVSMKFTRRQKQRVMHRAVQPVI